MRIRDVIAVALVAACIHNSAPEDRGPHEAATDGHGSTIVATLGDGEHIGGELIAIDARAVFVLDGSALRVLARDQIASADLFEYQTASQTVGTWGVMGTLSTASHGFFLIISAPIWIAASIWATAAESRAPRIQYPDRPLDDFVPWTRFPQGMPAGMTGAILFKDERPRDRAPGATP